MNCISNKQRRLQYEHSPAVGRRRRSRSEESDLVQDLLDAIDECLVVADRTSDANGSVNRSFQKFQQCLERFRPTAVLDPMKMQSLPAWHGTLLLLLARLLTGWQHERVDDDDDNEHDNQRQLLRQHDRHYGLSRCVSTVCNSLHAIYGVCFGVSWTASSAISSQDCTEAFFLLVQLSHQIGNLPECSKHACITTTRKHALDTAGKLVAFVSITSSSDRQGCVGDSRELVLSIVSMAAEAKNHGDNAASMISLLCGIQANSKCCIETRQYARVAFQVLNDTASPRQVRPDESNIREKLFRLQCQLLFRDDAAIFGASDDIQIGRLLSMATDSSTDPTEAQAAAECLSTLCHRSIEERCLTTLQSELRKSLVRVVLYGSQEAKREAILGLEWIRPDACNRGQGRLLLNDLPIEEGSNKTRQVQCFLSSIVQIILARSCSKVEQRLVKSWRTSSRGDVDGLATKLLLSVFENLLLDKTEWLNMIEPGELLNICAVLMEHQDWIVVKHMAQWVCQVLFMTKTGFDLVMMHCPEILRSIGDVLHRCVHHRTALSKRLAKTILLTLGELSQQETTCAALIGIPNLLSTIVELCAYPHEQDARARELSATILINMSSDVGSRRVLARQVGLVASLIRFTRELPSLQPSETHLASHALQRESIKDSILLLAAAL